MVDNKTIIEAGYREYPTSKWDHDGITHNFQKKFVDESGRAKYFIDIHRWKEWTHPYTNQVQPASYEYTAQLYSKDKREPVNLIFFSGWSIEKVELYVEHIWQTGLYDYYEILS